MEKITQYLFVDEGKKRMMRSMGYLPVDYGELYNIISEKLIDEFLKNKYKLKTLNKHGQKFQINYKLYGKRDHTNEIFNVHTGCTMWPYGQILVSTPIIKD